MSQLTQGISQRNKRTLIIDGHDLVNRLDLEQSLSDIIDELASYF